MGALKNNLRAAVDRLAALDVTLNTDGIPETVQGILERLQAGQRWLTLQQEFYLIEDPRSARDAQFGRALAAWTELERVLRRTDYLGCIWAPDGLCPVDVPVVCDACIRKAEEEPVTPAAQLGLAIGGVGHSH